MSDFDKEAEREKLREKFEADDQKRAATEQMSELLLKGATMTNAHCTDCGDPIFRYDGQEFCPTCQKPVSRDQPDDVEDADDQIEVADPSDDAHVQFGGEQAADEATQTEEIDETATRQSDTPTQSASRDESAQRVPSADPERSPAVKKSPSTADAERSPTAETSPSTADSQTDEQSTSTRTDTGEVATELSAAESLLAETVHRFAQQAAATDSPKEAREQLTAAREAAEALDAVRF